MKTPSINATQGARCNRPLETALSFKNHKKLGFFGLFFPQMKIVKKRLKLFYVFMHKVHHTCAQHVRYIGSMVSIQQARSVLVRGPVLLKVQRVIQKIV
jgi:hypothetical protein